jgi:hypothetical protein
MRDKDIREKVRALVAERHDPKDTLVVDELGLCQGAVRVDVAVVNGSIHGYEIKSDVDTLVRLPGQVVAYSKALDRATVVCGTTHFGKVRVLVPKWWGIMVAESHGGDIILREKRKDRPNPSLDLFSQAQLLWRDEALAALEERELATGLRSKPRRVLWRSLADQRPEDVGGVVRCALKNRHGWRAGA